MNHPEVEIRNREGRNPEVAQRVADEYRWGFVTDIEQETAPRGLNEDGDPAHLARRRASPNSCWTGASRRIVTG